jgi:hypothetical protein
VKLHQRYNYFDWTRANFNWHISEAAALKAERFKMSLYQQSNRGNLPPFNDRGAGGGRQIYLTCKAMVCANGALVGNYGYCGVHRR